MTDDKEEFIKFVCDTFDKLKTQFVDKQNQYGKNDALKNFRTGAKLLYGKDSYAAMYATALGYENKHVSHVYNNNIYGNKIDESLKDIAIYSVIELYLIYKNNLQKSEKI